MTLYTMHNGYMNSTLWENFWCLRGRLCTKNIITQGQFSYLPKLSLPQIEAQISYAISQNYAISVEYTEDPHPRNSYWEMWGFPQFDLEKSDVSSVVSEMSSCIEANQNCYVKVLAFDNSEGVESTVMSFIVHRPEKEASYELLRTEGVGRNQIYSFRKRSDGGGLRQ